MIAKNGLSARTARCLLALAASLIATGNQLPAATVFQLTSFEPPFTTGTLAGQFGWIGSTVPVVQNTVVASGSQAVALAATGQTQQQMALHSIGYNAAGNPETFVFMQITFQQSLSGAASVWNPIAVFGDSGFIGALYVETNGTIRLGAADSVVAGTPLTRGQWQSFMLIADFSNQTLSAYIGSSLFGTSAFANPATQLTFAGFALNSFPGTDTGYFDNFAVISDQITVPEPSTVWFVAGASVLFIAARKRRLLPAPVRGKHDQGAGR